MNENHISNFLERFKKILFKKDQELDIVIQVIYRHTSFLFEPKNIKIRNSKIHLHGSPILHSEVLMHKQGILSDINALLAEGHFTDIQ